MEDAHVSYLALLRLFHKMDDSSQKTKGFIRVATELSESYKQINFLSINMIAEAERIGEQGKALTVTSETFAKWSKEIKTSANELRLNSGYFLEAPERIFSEVRNRFYFLQKKLRELASANTEMRYALAALKLIRQNGKIETARLHGTQQNYNNHLAGMQGFIEQVSKASDQIGSANEMLQNDIKMILEEVSRIENHFRNASASHSRIPASDPSDAAA